LHLVIRPFGITTTPIHIVLDTGASTAPSTTILTGTLTEVMLDFGAALILFSHRFTAVFTVLMGLGMDLVSEEDLEIIGQTVTLGGIAMEIITETGIIDEMIVFSIPL